MKKKLLLFITSFSFVISSFSQLQITEISEIRDDSLFLNTSEINDGIIAVIVTGGEPPYQYYWSNKNTALDENISYGCTEGTEYSVLVTDIT